jgi:hypothetical protein
MTNFITKDNWVRKEFDTGMVRDTNEGKARFDLLIPNDVPYQYQLLTRFANLLARWAEKYTERNWEKAETREEYNRFKESAFRHFMQRYCWELDEDHAAAVLFNIMWADTVSYKIMIQ